MPPHDLPRYPDVISNCIYLVKRISMRLKKKKKEYNYLRWSLRSILNTLPDSSNPTILKHLSGFWSYSFREVMCQFYLKIPFPHLWIFKNRVCFPPMGEWMILNLQRELEGGGVVVPSEEEVSVDFVNPPSSVDLQEDHAALGVTPEHRSSTFPIRTTSALTLVNFLLPVSLPCTIDPL